MALRRFMFLTVWIHQFFPHFTAESKCNNKLISSINITTELQSDVLLPCFFDPTLLGSDQTADVAAVWSQRNITTDNLLEISLQGEVRFWTNRGGRIQPFSKLSKPGNFSILLKDVQQSDLGLYLCELHNGTNCRIAYQEISLQLGAAKAFVNSPHAVGVPAWLLTAGVLGGIVLLTFLLIVYFCAKRRKVTSDQTVCKFHPSDTSHTAAPLEDTSDQTVYKYTLDNPIYDTLLESQPNNCAKEDEEISPAVPVYAIIKKGKRAPKEKNKLEEVQL